MSEIIFVDTQKKGKIHHWAYVESNISILMVYIDSLIHHFFLCKIYSHCIGNQ